MDPRLQEASFSGDVHSLQELLREDRLLLNRPTYCTDTPLHVAAALGHAEFASEVFRLRPDLAFELGAGGHTPLHLAAANGHVAVVKVLLLMMLRRNNNAAELCLLRDKDGLTPLHAAALKGRTDVLRELVGACPDESVVRAAVTGRGETVLHLAVRSSSFEAVEFLVERVGEELLNSKDDKGNTALHLAVARKQLQTTKLMLSKTSVDVNSVNVKGLTPLDVLLESPDGQYGDMALAEMILAAGGKAAAEVDQLPPAPAVLPPRRAILRQKSVKKHEEYRNTPGTLMVVATLIATITFQAALNPPVGFMPGGMVAGPGVLVPGNNLDYFLMFDVVGLFASLSIILLLICVAPKRKRMIGFLSWIMWAAVISTALAFQCAIRQIYMNYVIIDLLFIGWFAILGVATVWIYFRFAIFLLKRVGWWNGIRHGHTGRSGVLLVVKRIGVVAAVLVAIGATMVAIFILAVRSISINYLV